MVFNVATLGEYPTTVKRIRIQEASSGKIILELATETGTPQIHEFRLSLGDNQALVADPEHGSYHVMLPKDKGTFFLQPRVNYRVSIYGEGWLPITCDIAFGADLSRRRP